MKASVPDHDRPRDELLPAEPWRWPQAREDWTTLARRRARHFRSHGLVLLAVAAALFAALLAGLATMRDDDPPRTLLELGLLPALLMAGFGACWLAAARFARHELIPLARRTRVAICPHCAEALVAGPEGDRDSCPRCDRRFDRAYLERWWWLWAGHGHSTAHRCLSSRWEAWFPGSDPVWVATWRRHRIARLAAMALIMLGLALVFFDDPPVVALARAIPLVFALTIPYVLSEVWACTRQRVGTEWRCARCGYQRSPHGPHPVLCPECGAVWGPKGTLVRGRPRLRWPAALGITVVAVALMMLSLMRSDRLATAAIRLVPTSGLINAICDPAGGSQRLLWAELNRRTLSAAQRRELAGRLIDQVFRTRPVHRHRALQWLASQIRSGTLDEDLTTRFFTACLKPGLEVSGPATVGQETVCALCVCVRRRVPLVLLGADVYIVLERFTIDETPVYPPVPGSWSAIRFRSDPCGELRVRWTPDRPGEYTLRATFQLVVGPVPGFPYPGADWGVLHRRNPDGSFALPAGTLWSQRVVLSRELIIRPQATSAPALQP